VTRKTTGIIVLTVVITGVAAFAGYRHFRQPAQGTEVAAPVTEQPVYTMKSEENSSVYLYFSDREDRLLAQEQQVITRPGNAVECAKVIIDRLIKGSLTGLGRVIPEPTVLRAFYLDSDGTAYADFSREIGEKQPGGVHDEYMTVISIVDSLTMNIPEIKRVKFLIEGKEAETLAGHVNIFSPFTASMVPVR
jgi:spore germination protein GerM